MFDTDQILFIAISLLGLLWTAGMGVTSWLFISVIKNKSDIQLLKSEKYTHEAARTDQEKFLVQISELTKAIHTLEVSLAQLTIRMDENNITKLRLIGELKDEQTRILKVVESMREDIEVLKVKPRGGR